MIILEFRGLVMAACGVTVAVVALNTTGFVGIVLAMAAGFLIREGYDWWMGNIQDTPIKEERSREQ